MNALSYYSGYDHACLLGKLAAKAQSLQSNNISLLKDTTIRISSISSSISSSSKTLEMATLTLNPVLRQLCFLIQKIVFWCLGVGTLTAFIQSKKDEINTALSLANQSELLNITLLTEIDCQREFIPVTIHQVAGENSESLFQIRLDGQESMLLTNLESTLHVRIQTSLLIESLVDLAMEIAAREGKSRLEIEAGDVYAPLLQQKTFDVEHRPDLERSLTLAQSPLPREATITNKFESNTRDVECVEEEEEVVVSYGGAPPSENIDSGIANDSVLQDTATVKKLIQGNKENIWWIDLPKPTTSLISADKPTLNQLKTQVAV